MFMQTYFYTSSPTCDILIVVVWLGILVPVVYACISLPNVDNLNKCIFSKLNYHPV